MGRCPACHRRLQEGRACPLDGGRAAELPREPPGAPPALATLELGEPLGQGGFATVWAARDPASGRALAVKVARSGTASVAARFRREAEALAAIGPPAVPELVQSGTLPDGRSLIVMQRLAGEPLSSWLAAQPEPPPTHRVHAVAAAILRALAAVHAAGRVHRDLKPENVFVHEGPPLGATLIDLGLITGARDGSEPAMTREGTVLGTPEYMAPEQFGIAEAGAAADLYAFGVILFELLTLRPPFVGSAAELEHAHRNLRPPRPGEITSVSEALEEIALSCLAKQPERRPASVAALGERLLAAAGADRATPRPERRASLLSEARQPIVLLGVDGDGDGDGELAGLLAAVERRRGFVARQQGARHIFGFSSLDSEDPVAAAIDSARELEGSGLAVVLHIASLALRRRGDAPPVVMGAALDRSERWWPPARWRGLVLTRELAHVVGSRGGAELTAAELPEFHALAAPHGSSEAEPPLAGRDAELAACVDAWREALAARSPALCTVVAEPGLGRSRLGRAVAAAALELAPAAEVVELQVEPGAADRDGNLTRLVGLAGADTAAAAVIARALWSRARHRPLLLVVDDAHAAEDPFLDALEQATLDEPGAPLLVLALARPSLLLARPRWAARARLHRQLQLAPLDEEAGRKLAAEWLRPAEYVPRDTLARLHRWAGGNPYYLRELVRALKRAAIVRRAEQGGGWYLATPELDRLPSSPVGQWFAARELDALPPQLAALARLLSVLGDEVGVDEIEAVQDSIDRAGGAGTRAEARAGLAQLSERGLLVPAGGDRWRFKSATLRDAIAQALSAADRRSVHGHALACWRARRDAAGATGDADAVATLEPLARHALGAGEPELAIEALSRLEAEARRRHRWVEADGHATAALAAMPEAPEQAGWRARLHFARGKARTFLHRLPEALDDLRRARGFAAAAGDRALLLDVLLEEATALDWAEQYQESEAVALEARPLADEVGDAPTRMRVAMATARSQWRSGELGPAVATFEAIAAEPQTDHETRVVTLLMLGPALVQVDRVADAERCFDEVIELCTRSGDLLHLCTAHANRLFLWAARHTIERGREDLERAITLARDVGHPWLERTATLNLAELLHWSGELAEALRLAVRARTLHERFAERAMLEDTLLVARVHAARGEQEQARALVAWMRERCPPPQPGSNHDLLLRMLEIVVDPRRDERDARWAALEAEAEPRLMPEELLEIKHWRALEALSGTPEQRERGRALLAAAASVLAERPIWSARFRALSRPGG